MTLQKITIFPKNPRKADFEKSHPRLFIDGKVPEGNSSGYHSSAGRSEGFHIAVTGKE
jgi:hypothetical protein